MLYIAIGDVVGELHKQEHAIKMISKLSLGSRWKYGRPEVMTASERDSCVTIPIQKQYIRAKILVITGGSGRLGSIIAKIAYEYWDGLQEIRLFDQKSPEEKSTSNSTSGFHSKPRVTFFHGSVMDENSLLGAFANADVVIHCAAIVESGSILSRKKMKEVNADGSCNVVQACLDCGVQALVYTGSMAQVYSYMTKDYVEYEESLQPRANHELIFPKYGASKIEGEKFVLSANGQKGKGGVVLRTCSLRCPGMYGEGDTIFIGKILNASQNYFYGYLFPIGHSDETHAQAAYIGNCAWAHLLAAAKLLDTNLRDLRDHSRNGTSNGLRTKKSECTAYGGSDIGGNFYYIGDYTPKLPLAKFYEQFLGPIGQRVIPLKLPYILVWMIVFLSEILAFCLTFLGIDFHSPLNRNNLQYFKLDHSISWEKAKKELEYEPLYDYQTALSRSIAFYRQKYLN